MRAEYASHNSPGRRLLITFIGAYNRAIATAGTVPGIMMDAQTNKLPKKIDCAVLTELVTTAVFCPFN